MWVLQPGGVSSQRLTILEEALIGSNGDRVRLSRRKTEGCHSGLFSQALHFSAFGDGSGACCHHGGAAREWCFV